ncbi:hypothetical protein [Phytohabitans rumicis]|uniref:hypothetical protein n=1 Tax=Phytohabitans rumicis TaxID=1076125 RepID=UPI0031E9CC92
MTSQEPDNTGRSKPEEDQMHAAQPGAEDLVGEVATLAADPDSDDAEIIRRLAVLADQFSVDEVFAVMVRYDTPDILG